MIRSGLYFLPLLVAVLLGGCLEAPTVEEEWTRVEILSASPTTPDALVGGSDVPLEVRARITYRELLTGFLVADLRSSTVAPSDVDLEDDPEDKEDGLDVARDVDLIIQNSTSLAVEAMPITGFDHLIQEATLTFDATVPATASGTPLYLLVYFSSDVEELEDENGNELDSLLVTPTLSTERDILSAGLPIVPTPPGN